MNINDTFQYQNVGLPEDIQFHKNHGNFSEAIRLIDLRLSKDNIPNVLRYSLQVHREILVRLPDEFPYSKEEALSPTGWEEEAKLLGKRQIPGSVAFVPGAAGLILAGEVIKDLVK